MDRLDTTTTSNRGSAKENQQANYTSFASFLNGLDDIIILVLQVML